MTAKEIIDALMDGKITKKQAERLIESFEKKKTKPVKKMKGRPISMDKVENDKAIISLWVVYSEIQPRFKMKLRAILADGLGLEDSYINKCIANMNKLIKSGEVHIYKVVDSKNRLRVFCLDKETLNLIQTSPEEAEKKLKSDWYHSVGWKDLTGKVILCHK